MLPNCIKFEILPGRKIELFKFLICSVRLVICNSKNVEGIRKNKIPSFGKLYKIGKIDKNETVEGYCVSPGKNINSLSIYHAVLY